MALPSSVQDVKRSLTTILECATLAELPLDYFGVSKGVAYLVFTVLYVEILEEHKSFI